MSHGEGAEKGSNRHGHIFLSVVYLTLALNSPVKICSLIHAKKKIHTNKAKYTIKCFFYIFSHKFHKTVKFLI